LGIVVIRDLRQGALDPTEAVLQAPDVETQEEGGLGGAGQLLIGVGPDGPGVASADSRARRSSLARCWAREVDVSLVRVIPNMTSADARAACACRSRA